MKNKSSNLRIIYTLIVALLAFAIISNSVSAALISDSGNSIRSKTTGSLLSSGNITITIYNAPTGGSPIYNKTFYGNITNGSWNFMLNPDLEFGNIYYKDYTINGQDFDFDGDERLAFQSSTGLLNNLSYFNYSRLGLSNYAFANQSQYFVENFVSSGNISTNQSGFFSFLGNFTNSIVKLWVYDINATGNVLVKENVTARYFVGNGSLLTSVAGINNSFNQSLTDTIYAGLANINDNNSAWLSTYNATYASNIGNASFNQSMTDLLYANLVIINGNNSAWLSTFNNSYALATTVNGNNSAWLSTFNSTYAASSGNASWNQTLANTLYAPASAGNASFNQTLTNSLYAPASAGNASWNQSLANLLYAGLSLVNGNNSAWLSTYNATYASNIGNASFNQSMTDLLYGPNPIIRTQRADIASSNVSVRNFTMLNFGVRNNTNYTLDCIILYTGAAATTGLSLNISTTTLINHVTISYNTWSSATAPIAFSANSATVFSNLTGTGSGAGVIYISKYFVDFGTIRAGNINLTIGSEVGGSAATLKKGSICQLYDVTQAL